ncbi:MAG: hypothetical protein JSR77_02595 [Planctomycetes bacterium]|nr:hypothetical protein [Planctomycetota bacterium]
MALIRSMRRSRVAFFSVVTALAATAALVLINVLADRFHLRFDATSTGSQRLADRTQQLLSHLDKRHEIVIAADMAATDRRAKERLTDVLEEFRRKSDQIDYTILDTGSASGVRGYKDLLKRLVARESTLLDQQVSAIDLHLGGFASLSGYLNDTISPRLLEIESQIPAATDAGKANRDYFTQAAATARVAAKDLTAAATKAGELLKFKIEDTAIPQTTQAAGAMADALSPTVEQLGVLAKELRRFADVRDNDGPAADAAKALLPDIAQRRDQAAVVLDSLRKLRRPDILRIVDALRTGNAAIVIGPPDTGLCALDLSALLPSGAWLDANSAVKADQGRRVEELLATALSSIRNPNHPIVVLMHAEAREFFDEVPIITLLKQRLDFRGIDVVEWAVLLRQEPPKLTGLDPDRKRPVIFAAMSPDSTAPSQGKGQPTGIQRAEKLAAVLDKLAGEGRGLIVSLNPSIAPTYGEPDPFSKVLARFSLASESGRPLLREQSTGGTRTVETDAVLQADEDSKNALAAAVRGLPTFLSWPIALFERRLPEDPARVDLAPILQIAAGPNVWLESQWLRLAQTPREQRGLLPDAPRFDDGRDSRWPNGTEMGNAVQRWTIAYAAERTVVGSPPQRMLVVGSNGWFFDGVVGRQAVADGRRVAAYPGNLELFENAVYWLANQDDLIAQSPVAKAAPMIVPINEAAANRLRLALIVGLPILALLAGVLVRVIRG